MIFNSTGPAASEFLLLEATELELLSTLPAPTRDVDSK